MYLIHDYNSTVSSLPNNTKGFLMNDYNSTVSSLPNNTKVFLMNDYNSTVSSLPNNTKVFLMNAGRHTTSSYVLRSSWSKMELCLAKYLSFFFFPNHEQWAKKQIYVQIRLF